MTIILFKNFEITTSLFCFVGTKLPNSKFQNLGIKSPTDTANIEGGSLIAVDRRTITDPNSVGVRAIALGGRPIVAGHKIISETGYFMLTYTNKFF